MAITVGTNSFIDVAYADSFWQDRNGQDWATASQGAKEAALIKATDYVNTLYEWPGTIADESQELSWPRVGAFDREGRKLTGIPEAIKKATAYLAGKAVEGSILFEVGDEQPIEQLKAESVEIHYMEGSGGGGSNSESVYNYLTRVLSLIVNTNSNQVRLVRV